MNRQSNPERLLKECLLTRMDIIGEKFTDGTVFIPETTSSPCKVHGLGIPEGPHKHSTRKRGQRSDESTSGKT
jgi:methanogenic corrinoid protein MtbC1